MYPKLAARDIVLLILLSAAAFFAFYDPAILDPHKFGWLLRGTDNGENALGLHAWQNDPGAQWSLRTALLNSPDGVSILFTDSNPLLAMVTLPIARHLGTDLQFVGLWMLTSLALQAIFAFALLRSFAPSRITLWLGVALFMLVPTFYARQYHVNLQAHWIILWALWIFIDDKRAYDARWWTGALLVAALVHNYLLFLVSAVWATALARELWTAATVKARAITIGRASLTSVIIILVISNLGIDRDFVATSTYGVFAMPLDALWRPSNPTYSTLLPATDRNLRSSFEGFQYLGAGLLLLLFTASLPIKRTPGRNGASINSKLVWLVPACVVMTLLAITHQLAWADRIIVELPLDPAVVAALDPLRASGRLFWLVTYTLILFAVANAYRLTPPRALQLLTVALAIQITDLRGVMAAMRQTTAEAAEPSPWKRTRDPRWASVIASASDVTFAPANPFIQLDLFQEVAWRSASAGRPIRLVYAARNSRVTDARLSAEDADFNAGRLDPNRLYVVLPEANVPKGAANRVLILDGIRLLVPEPKASARSAPS